MRTVRTILIFLTVFSSLALGSGDFEGIDNVLTEGHQAGTAALGVGLLWFFSSMLIIFPVGGAVYGYMFAKKKAEQQQEGSNKMAISVIVGAVVGVFAGLLFIALSSQVMTGDSSQFLSNIWEFITRAMQSAVAK